MVSTTTSVREVAEPLVGTRRVHNQEAREAVWSLLRGSTLCTDSVAD